MQALLTMSLAPLYSTAFSDARSMASRDSAYWVRNMINPVLLTSAVRAAAEDGYKLFLEVSSHPIISHSVNETLMSLDVDDAIVVPTLLRNKPTSDTLLKAIANLWCRGAPVDFRSSFAGLPWATDLPKNKWRHQSYWKDIGAGSINSEEYHDRDAHTLLGHQIPVAGSDAIVYTTQLDDGSRPFPGRHPLHGTEIVPAAVLFNTFFQATKSSSVNDVQLRVPVAISAPRDVQVVVQDRDVRIMSRLIQAEQTNASWLTHTTGKHESQFNADLPTKIDIASVTKRIGAELSKTFTIDYLAAVGVPDMGFPWTVVSHWGTTEEMIAKVDVSPETKVGQAFPWHASSWAPVFDAATSIGSTIFFNEPRLRMPAHVANVMVVEGAMPPKMAYIHVRDSSKGNIGPASDVTITNENGIVLAKFTSMRFSEIEASRKGKDDVDGLVHTLAWPPARLSETPHALEHVVLLGNKSATAAYGAVLRKKGIKADCIDSPAHIGELTCTSPVTFVYVPETAATPETISETTEANCKTLLDVVKAVTEISTEAKIFVLTNGALHSDLSNSALVGLSRIIAAEQPNIWGALVDIESPNFPFQAVKYVRGADIVKVEDSVARVARLRPMPAAKQVTGKPQLDVRPEGTYLITGGLGDLGLEVADSLVEKGARRVVLVSRRSVPPRKTWASAAPEWKSAIEKIQALESKGASVYTIAVDMAASNAAEQLSDRLDSLNVPAVLGVIHAAGK
jgi:6-methylsalicylic acid synthase